MSVDNSIRYRRSVSQLGLSMNIIFLYIVFHYRAMEKYGMWKTSVILVQQCDKKQNDVLSGLFLLKKIVFF